MLNLLKYILPSGIEDDPVIYFFFIPLAVLMAQQLINTIYNNIVKINSEITLAGSTQRNTNELKSRACQRHRHR